MESLTSYLPYLTQPLLGAVIGYVTNDIAIRMLFRPLRPWRVLGVRVPLTPGIIPSKRGELASKMGEMVGSHLLTSEDVGRALGKDSFRRELQGVIGDKVGGFLERDLGSLESLVPAEFKGRFREMVGLVRGKLTREIFDFLASPVFEQMLRGYLRNKGNEFLSRDLESFLTPEKYQVLRNHLDERIGIFLGSEEFARALGDFIDGRTERLVSSNRSLRELIPPDLIEELYALLDREVPQLLEKFGGMMYDPEFRARIITKARVGIEAFLDTLEGLTAIMAGFVDLESIYKKLPEFLDKAAEEISLWLREEKTQTRISRAIRQRIDGFIDRPLGSLLEKMPYEKVSAMRRFAREKAVAAARSPRSAQMMLALTERGIGRVKDRSFGSLLREILPEGGIDRGREALADRLLSALRSAGAQAGFSFLLQSKVESFLFVKPLGKLSARVPMDVRQELEEGIFRQLAEVLKKEVPPLVETLNVSRIVEDKVNSLDLLQVEGLLMGIMKEQFKYINLFGALLGGLIGAVNLMLMRLPG